MFSVSDVVIKGTVKSYSWKYEDGMVYEVVEVLMNQECRVEHSESLDNAHYTPFQSVEIDKKYPHICFRCKKPLKFMELRAANRDKEESYLKNLWELEGIEFFCCTCYKEKDKNGKPA